MRVFHLVFHNLSAYKALLRQKQELFDGQEGFEATRMDAGRCQNIEDARQKEDESWTHCQSFEAN
jgi:hypothetical protein